MARLYPGTVIHDWRLPYSLHVTGERALGNHTIEVDMEVHIRRWHPRLWWWLVRVHLGMGLPGGS